MRLRVAGQKAGEAACRVSGDASAGVRRSNVARERRSNVAQERRSNVAQEEVCAGKPAVTKTTRVFSKRAIWRKWWTRAATVD